MSLMHPLGRPPIAKGSLVTTFVTVTCRSSKELYFFRVSKWSNPACDVKPAIFSSSLGGRFVRQYGLCPVVSYQK